MHSRHDRRGNSCLALCIILLSPLVFIMLCMDSCVGNVGGIQLDDAAGGCAELGTQSGMCNACLLPSATEYSNSSLKKLI